MKKVRKKVFYIHTNIVTKKKRAKHFFQKHTNSASKKYFEKISSEKSAKKVFYIHTNIVTKKWGDKTSETIFPETHE